jgi:serine/threonine-protein kinase
VDVLPEGTALDDKYRIVRHLSSGGMGAVYEVEHRGLGKRLAAKMLKPELVRRADLLERSVARRAPPRPSATSTSSR